MERKTMMAREDTDFSDMQYKYCIGALKALIKDPAFLKQRKTLEEIHKALEKSNDSWKKLNTKCQRLELEIGTNVSKIKAAIQLSEEDKSTIDTLKEELEKSWKIADEVRSKTSRSHLKRQSSFQEMYGLDGNSSERFIHSTNKIDAVGRKSFLQLDMQSKMIENLKAERAQLEQDLKHKNALIQEKTDRIDQLESNLKKLEELNRKKEITSEDHYKLMTELENNRLHLFEMEEEIANKEKIIEELTDKNETERRALQEKEREISVLKAKQNSKGDSSDYASRETVSKASMTDSNNSNNKLQSLETQLNYMITKDMKIRSEFTELEVKLMEKISQLTESKRKHKILRVELREKTEKCKALTTQCDLLKDELSKSTITIRELESIRDKNVCNTGHLEMKILELKKELVEFKHCKYPEVIQRLSKEFQGLREELEKERESMFENKKTWEAAITEKNELKEFVAKIKKQMRVALQFINSFQSQKDTKYQNQADAWIYNATIADQENAADLSSHFKKLVDYLVELCKALMEENQRLNAEIKCTSKLSNANMNELGIHEPIETYYSEVDRVSASTTGLFVNDYDALENTVSIYHDDELKDTDTSKFKTEYELYNKTFSTEMEHNFWDQNATNTLSDHSEEFDNVKGDTGQVFENGTTWSSSQPLVFSSKERFIKKSQCFGSEWKNCGNQLELRTEKLRDYKITTEHELSTSEIEDTNTDQDVVRHQEFRDAVKGDNRQVAEDRTSRRHKPRIVVPSKQRFTSKSEFFIKSPEWMEYRNQLKLKTKKLQSMEAKFETFNSDFSTRNPIYSKDRWRQKKRGTTSVQQLSLERFRKDLNKHR